MPGSELPSQEEQSRTPHHWVELLRAGKPVFGLFPADKTPETARRLASDEEADFVFYDLEHGPFDVAAMKVFLGSLAGRPMVTRLPPIRDGFAEAAVQAKQLVEAGIDGVVFPHVENRAQAEHAVRSVRQETGAALVILIVEDRIGVQNAREIVATPGVDVVIPGPGDLRRAYDGDAVAVEKSIQTVLAACKESRVVCGITAGAEDVEKRLEQGFCFIIGTGRAAIAVGRRAAKGIEERPASANQPSPSDFGGASTKKE